MLVIIRETFDTGSRRFQTGETLDVDPVLARRWIADGKATVAPAGKQIGPYDRGVGTVSTRATWPAQKRAVPNVWQRPADISSWAWLWLVDTQNCPSITNPLGRYYLYFTTDHEARSGVRLAYTNDLFSGWTLYRGGLAAGDSTIIYEDLDDTTSRAPCASTETPSVVYDTSIGMLRMYYHCYNPCYGNGTGALTNPTDPTGARSGCTPYSVEQGTMSATSPDGITWTKDRNFALDNWFNLSQHGVGLHTGYFRPSIIDGRMFGYHIGGGGDSGSCLMSYAPTSDFGSLVTENVQLNVNARACYEAGRPNETITWHGGQGFKTAQGLFFIGVCQTPNSGGAAAASQAAFAAPLREDMRTLDGPMNIFDTTYFPGGFIESGDGGLYGTFTDGDKMGIYYVR